MDSKIVSRVRKLLALAKDAGATEAEAALAATRAAEIMEEHGLTTATVELQGGVGEGRSLAGTAAVGLAREDWALTLMQAVAESCFCLAEPQRIGRHLERFTIVGRESAVASCCVMYEYLSRVVIRLSRHETGSQRYFRFGCAERIAQRLKDRHRAMLHEQREREERAQQAAPQGSNALTVVLEDYELSERDLNEDYRRGVAPGTTAQERREREAQSAEREERMRKLQDEGHSWDIAFWMVFYGLTVEEAHARESKHQEGRQQRYRERYRERVNYTDRRRESESYQRGHKAGENVSLNRQVGETKKLSS